MTNQKKHKEEKETKNIDKPISLFNNKKGQLDVVTHLLQSVSNFLSTAPPIVLYILFLVFLAFIGVVIGYALNFTGFYCNSAGEPVKIDFNPISTVGLLFDQPEPDDLTGTTITVSNSCLVRAVDGGTIEDLNTNEITNFTGERAFYDGRFCNQCDNVVEVKVYIAGSTVVSETATVCEGDASTKNVDDFGFLQRTLCEEDFGQRSRFFDFSACQIPQNYRYEDSQEKYVCADTGECITNTVAKQWDKTLEQKGGELVYPTGNPELLSENYKDIFIIQCSESNAPRLTIKGIDIFDFRLWMLLSLIFIMMWAWRNFG